LGTKKGTGKGIERGRSMAKPESKMRTTDENGTLPAVYNAKGWRQYRNGDVQTNKV